MSHWVISSSARAGSTNARSGLLVASGEVVRRSLFFLFKNDYPSDEVKKRHRRLLVSNWKYVLFVLGTQHLAVDNRPCLGLTFGAGRCVIGSAVVASRPHGQMSRAV